MKRLLVLLVLVGLLIPSGVSAAPPTVGTLPATYISSEEALVGLVVEVTGGWATEEWGIEYGKLPGGYTNEVLFQEVIEQVTLQSLQPDTTYYYRAKASSRDGWGYGEERQFTTMPVGSFWKVWTVVEDVWVGWNGHEWYMKQGPVIFVGYSCLVDVACGGGFRFEFDIPEGMKVEESFLRFKASGSQFGIPKTKLSISKDGGSFVDTEDYFGRERLVSFNWDSVEMFEDGKTYRSPDISGLVQRVVGKDEFVVFWEDHDDRSVRGNPRMADQRVVYSDATVLEARWSIPKVEEGSESEEESKGVSWPIVGLVSLAVAGTVVFVARRKLTP